MKVGSGGGVCWFCSWNWQWLVELPPEPNGLAAHRCGQLQVALYNPTGGYTGRQQNYHESSFFSIFLVFYL
jgi:hypothetical protein